MKTLGIVGGIGPESTVDYYRLVIDAYRQRIRDGSYPSLVINSIDVTRLLSLVAAGQLTELVAYLTREVQRLAGAGADFALFASNTPHIVFDEVQERSSIPLISIVQATCDAARGLDAKVLGLLGTRFTMQGAFYPAIFAKAGIKVHPPEADDLAFVHEKYMSELLKGLVVKETRARFLSIIARMKERHGIDGVILGGTELPLILRDATQLGIPVLDTTRIHVEAAVARLLPLASAEGITGEVEGH